MIPVDLVLADIIAGYQTLSSCRAIASVDMPYGNSLNNHIVDIELIILLSEQLDESMRKSVIQKVGDLSTPIESFDFPYVWDRFISGGYSILVWHISQDCICDQISRITRNQKLCDLTYISLLQNSRIQWDPKQQLKVWQHWIQPIPADYLKFVLPFLYADSVAIVHELKNGVFTQNNFYTEYKFFTAVDHLCNIVFLLNNQYMTISWKIVSILKRLKIIPENFITGIETLFSSTQRDTDERWRLLVTLTYDIGKLMKNRGEYNINSAWNMLRNDAPFVFNQDEFTDTEKFAPRS